MNSAVPRAIGYLVIPFASSTLASVTDAYGRITSVKRKLGAAQIEQRTTYDATYPVEPASVVDNYVNGTVGDGSNPTVDDRTTSWTYVASSLGLVSRMTEPLTASTHRTTDYTYNSNNDLTQKIVALDGSGTTRTVTRYCYDASCTTSGATTLTMSKQIDNYVDGAPGNGAANVEDVTTTYLYDAYGQQTRATRSNYNAAGTLLDSAATGHTYDSLGNVTADIANYSNGTVTSPGDDITPNATTNARTDLTTAYAYDTGGNRVSTADPRRAIETAKGTSLGTDDFISRSTFDPLGLAITTVLPTTAGISDCSPTPGCRTTTSIFDELGGVRQSTDPGGVVSGTESDRLGHSTRTFEDTDGAGTTPAATTSTATFDAAGRTLTMKDRNQSAAGSTLGATSETYDELGRNTDTTDASGSSPDVASITHRVFDALHRQTTETTGSGGSAAQTTTTAYDLGGRAISTDDEFTCTTTAYDYRDLATQTVQGLASGTCTGGTPVTTTITNDGLGRVTLRSVDANNAPEANTYDAAGNTLVTSGKQAGTTTTSTYTVNPLDQVIVEVRTDGSTAKTNYDPAGSVTDRCYWKPSITVGACLQASRTLGVDWYNLTPSKMVNLTLRETHRPRTLSFPSAFKYFGNTLAEDGLSGAIKALGGSTVRNVAGMTVVSGGPLPMAVSSNSDAITIGHTVFIKRRLDAYNVTLLAHEYVHVLQQEGDVFNYSYYTSNVLDAVRKGQPGYGPANRREALGYLWQRWLDAYYWYDLRRPEGAKPSWCYFKPLFAGPDNRWRCG